MIENEDIFVRLDTLCVVDGNRQNTIKKNWAHSIEGGGSADRSTPIANTQPLFQ